MNNYMFPVYFYNRNLNGNLPIIIHFIFPYEDYDVVSLKMKTSAMKLLLPSIQGSNLEILEYAGISRGAILLLMISMLVLEMIPRFTQIK